MPATRTLASRSAQRRTKPDDFAMRTRSSGRGKSAKTEKTEFTTMKSSPTSNNGSVSLTRKSTRSSSDGSSYSVVVVGGPSVRYEDRKLIITGLPHEFLSGLITKSASKSRPVQTKSEVRSHPQSFTKSEDSDDGDFNVGPSPRVTTGRGRGRGGRGGRGRGRGRGGISKEVSPKRTRPPRIAAPQYSMLEPDEESPSNQETPIASAKGSLHSDDEDSLLPDVPDDDREHESDLMQDGLPMSTTPKGSPPPKLQTPESTSFPNQTIPPSNVPIVSVREPSTQTPQDSVPTPAESEAPQLLNPEDDVLSDSDLPPPFILDFDEPNESDCEDRADFLVKERFKPMTDPQEFIAALTKYPVHLRSTANLYELALNTQRALQAWQDQYLILDAKTAPHAHPPKKPATGGRIPIATAIYEDLKEADLYGYVYDSKKAPGFQDPFAQRPGRDNAGGRELRQRRARDMIGSAAQSEDDEDEEMEGRRSRRKRGAVHRFDGTEPGTGTTTPRRNGWGGPRKRGVSALAASETPEPESGRAKRARVAANSLLPTRIQEIREESAVPSSGDEGGRDNKRRGRPPGSKNLHTRSDAGIKKGPRKSANLGPAKLPKVAPLTLESLSQGQNQFSVEPMDSTPPSQLPIQGIPQPPTVAPTAGVFTPAPPSTMTEMPPGTAATSSPEHFITTTPLSQYGGPNANEDASSTSTGGKRGKPRVKSEKRSQSMTIWWAERKARQQKEAEEKKAAEAAQRATLQNADPFSAPPPPEHYQGAQISTSTPPTPSPMSSGPIYQRGPPPPPPPNIMTMSPSIAALPSNPAPSGPSPIQRNMPALAPAPPVQHYPSPYNNPGPTNPRPKSQGPPPLAPAPLPPHRQSSIGSGNHVSPYPPVGQGAGPLAPQPPKAQQHFKIMLAPAPATPTEDRKAE